MMNNNLNSTLDLIGAFPGKQMGKGRGWFYKKLHPIVSSQVVESLQSFFFQWVYKYIQDLVRSNASSQQQLKPVGVPHTLHPFQGGGAGAVAWGGNCDFWLRYFESIHYTTMNYNGQSMRQQTCETHGMAEKAQWRSTSVKPDQDQTERRRKIKFYKVCL